MKGKIFNTQQVQELNEAQLFLAFAVTTSLVVNWVFGMLLIITGLSFWAIYTIQAIIAFIALILIRKIK